RQIKICCVITTCLLTSQVKLPKVAESKLRAASLFMKKKWLSVGTVAHGTVAIGISAHGIVAIGVSTHGIVSIGIISMGIFSAGLVSMGLFSAGLVTMGLASFGANSMGLVRHSPPAQESPQSIPNTHQHHH
ncbi:MAG: hypothetical protein WBV73_26750, partial [Phormidium sp.]